MSESFWLRIALGTIGAYCALAAGGGGTTPLDAPTPRQPAGADGTLGGPFLHRPAPATEASVERQAGGGVTLTAGRLRINQRISEAAVP